MPAVSAPNIKLARAPVLHSTIGRSPAASVLETWIVTECSRSIDADEILGTDSPDGNWVVNPERVVKQRFREFWCVSSGSGRNRGGYVWTPKIRVGNRERGSEVGVARKSLQVTGYDKTPRALALGALR